MTSPSDEYRFGLIEKGLITLTTEVSRLAGVMERLVSVEERNTQTNQKMDMIEVQLRSDIKRLEETVTNTQKDVKDLYKAFWKATGALVFAEIIILPIAIALIVQWMK